MRTLILIIAAVLCTSVSTTEIAAQDLSGRWKGRWTSSATESRREHGGTLRMRLRPISTDGYSTVYKGTFAGRFAVIVPYFYRARVYQNGSHISSTKRLGPFGSYTMQLQPAGTKRLLGGWSAGKHNGSIRLSR